MSRRNGKTKATYDEFINRINESRKLIDQRKKTNYVILIHPDAEIHGINLKQYCDDNLIPIVESPIVSKGAIVYINSDDIKPFTEPSLKPFPQLTPYDDFVEMESEKKTIEFINTYLRR